MSGLWGAHFPGTLSPMPLSLLPLEHAFPGHISPGHTSGMPLLSTVPLSWAHTSPHLAPPSTPTCSTAMP